MSQNDPVENGDLQPQVIDLGVNRRGELSESFLEMFGGMIQGVLGRMFRGTNVPITVRGNKSEINSFSRLLGSEKKYMDAYKKFGLGDPRVLANKHKLSKAVSKFEQATGLPWVLK